MLSGRRGKGWILDGVIDIEEVKALTDMNETGVFAIGEFDWRVKLSDGVTRVTNSGEILIVGLVVHGAEEYFVDVMKQTGGCVKFNMVVKLLTREVILFVPIAEAVATEDEGVLCVDAAISSIVST